MRSPDLEWPPMRLNWETCAHIWGRWKYAAGYGDESPREDWKPLGELL